MTSRQRRCVEVIVNHPPNIDSHSNAAERERRALFDGFVQRDCALDAEALYRLGLVPR